MRRGAAKSPFPYSSAKVADAASTAAAMLINISAQSLAIVDVVWAA
jgi:hypothetical protein